MSGWQYSIRWGLPHIPCSGAFEIASVIVPEGEPVPGELMKLFVPGNGYCLTLDFLTVKEIKRWTAERKAAVRRRNLENRILKAAPLFFDEFVSRELTDRVEYFDGK